jgi:sulfite reductase beta subunit-like hemoprotein
MTDASEPHFPCDELPGDPGQARMLGVYEQRQPGVFMQRVKIWDGQITPAQLRALAELACNLSPEHPLHLTTRQDVEFHGVTAEGIPKLQAGIAAVGLTTVATCGDSLRNITVCPGSGRCSGSRDMADLRRAIETHAGALPLLRDLPRKFKISLSGCLQACARPWISDLGLIANADGSLTAVAAGSLGAKPQTGLQLYDALPLGDILPLVTAALRLFHAEGDRSNRRRARLRHVRERLGDDVFRARLHTLFEDEKDADATPAPEMPQTMTDPLELTRIVPPLGDLTPEQAIALADVVAGEPDGELRLGLEHDLFVYGVPTEKLPAWCVDLIGAAPIVACPGATWCATGLTNARAAAERLQGIVPPHSDLSIAISGCPNNCTHAAVADIGLVGRLLRVDGVRTDHYRLLIGGGRGATPEMAFELHPAVPVADVRQVVAGIIEEWRQAGKPSFSAWARAHAERLAKARPQ